MDTLVLSPSYEYVARVSWERAITLFFQGKVEILESYEDKDVRSVTFAIKMPSVVRFLQAIRGKRRAVKFSRENIYARDQGRCQYCWQKVSRDEFTYDHVIPRASGGKTTWENVVASCMQCNQDKKNRTPAEAGMRLRTTPVRPKRLPDVRITLVWRKGMPESWKSWVRSFVYWNGELDNDEGTSPDGALAGG